MNKTNPSPLLLFKNRRLDRAVLALALAISTAGLLPSPAKAGVAMTIVTNLFSFNGTNGYVPNGKLAQTPDGTFYGTTSMGGNGGGYGTIFKMSGGTVTSLFSFNNTNGYEPNSGMILAKDGNLYGTTQLGGSYLGSSQEYGLGCGTVFRFSPGGTFTNLASFNGTNGSLPNNLVQAPDGFLYGTTEDGGTNYNGSVTDGTLFKVDTNGNLTSLMSFNGTNGANPITGLTLASNGTLFGVSTVATFDNTVVPGTAFQVNTNGAFSMLEYINQTNGIQAASLVLGADGNFYGVCSYGGASGQGSVFQLKPDGTFTSLVSFDGTNGAEPQQLIQANDGYLYGVTATGGASSSGTVFRCSTDGDLTSLYSFTGGADGSDANSIMQAKDGNFYGTTGYGGVNGDGNIFKLTVVPTPNIESITATHTLVTINFAAASGQSYDVQYRPTLNLNTWSHLTTVNATNSVGVATDVIITNNVRFYRVVLMQ